MKINADFTQRVALHTAKMEWQASPMPGVERRMLDRIGDEIARATSMVRYAPGSHFAEHTHSGGEEFIVLKGVFQDEHGDYPAGSYVRNPIGTHHVPRSKEGCEIFVKLWQFASRDQVQKVMDLNALEFAPFADTDGVARAGVFEFGDELVVVEEWQAHCQREIGDPGGAELLILGGSLIWQGEEYGAHDWLRLPAGDFSAMQAGSEGVRIWMKLGHLRSVTAPSGKSSSRA